MSLQKRGQALEKKPARIELVKTRACVASTAQTVPRAKLAMVAEVEFPFFRLSMNQEASGLLSQTERCGGKFGEKNINVWGCGTLYWDPFMEDFHTQSLWDCSVFGTASGRGCGELLSGKSLRRPFNLLGMPHMSGKRCSLLLRIPLGRQAPPGILGVCS